MVEDFKRKDGSWVMCSRVPGGVEFTRAGRRWNSMTSRCAVGSKLQRIRPNYIGCTNNFKDFQEFASWCQVQIGYHEDGFHLDKDILGDGKSYSPEHCVFVPQKLNCILNPQNRVRGAYPQGVSYHKASGKLIAAVRLGNGKLKYLGLFTDVGAASEAYKKAKSKVVRETAAEFAGNVDPRVTAALSCYEVKDGS